MITKFAHTNFEFSSSPFSILLIIMGPSFTLAKWFQLPDVLRNYNLKSKLPLAMKVYYKYHHFGYKVFSISHFLFGKLQISPLINLIDDIYNHHFTESEISEEGCISSTNHIHIKKTYYESLRRIKTELPRLLLVFLANYCNIFFIRESYFSYNFCVLNL